MTGINALEYMPELNTFIQGGKKAIGKNKLYYSNDTLKCINCTATINEDGSITILGDFTSNDEAYAMVNIGYVLDYDKTKNYAIEEGSYTLEEDGSFHYETSLYKEWMPNITIYPQVEEGTEATEYEKPVIIEAPGHWTYTNDYTHPHLTSFADGWKCIYDSERIANIEKAIEEHLKA